MKRAESIQVIADATTMKDCSADLHPAVLCAFRMGQHLLKIMAAQFDTHVERDAHGVVELVDAISRFFCGRSCYHLHEQLHLREFAALKLIRMIDAQAMAHPCSREGFPR